MTTFQQLIDHYGAAIASINHNPAPTNPGGLIVELSSARDRAASCGLAQAYRLTAQAKHLDEAAAAPLLTEAEPYLREAVANAAPKTVRIATDTGTSAADSTVLNEVVEILNERGLQPNMARRLADTLNRHSVAAQVEGYSPCRAEGYAAVPSTPLRPHLRSSTP